MMDLVINVGWAAGVLVGWYPLYTRLLRSELASDPPEGLDRFFSFLLSGVLIFFWPLVIAAAVVSLAVFWTSERIHLTWRKIRSSS